MSQVLKYSYILLDLKPDASNVVLKKRYRELAKKYHPDVNKSPVAALQFDRIKKAYNLIKKARANGIDISLEEYYAKQQEVSKIVPTNPAYEQAEKMQEKYWRENAKVVDDEPTDLEFLGFHTAVLVLTIIFLFIALYLMLSGSTIAAIIFITIPGFIFLISAYLPVRLQWPRYWAELSARPALLQRIGRTSVILLLELLVLIKIVFYTVFPVMYYVMLALIPFLLMIRVTDSGGVSFRLARYLHFVVPLLFIINYYTAHSPITVKLELYYQNKGYYQAMHLVPSAQAQYYHKCIAIAYIPNQALGLHFKVFESFRGGLGLETVGNLRYK